MKIQEILVALSVRQYGPSPYECLCEGEAALLEPSVEIVMICKKRTE